MKTEKIIEDAEIAAVYFRTLMGEGLPTHVAAQITSSYVSYRVIAEVNRDKPRDPWDPPPG